MNYQVFKEKILQKAFEPFDWLQSTARALQSSFSSAESPYMRNLLSFVINRHSATSATCGTFDLMANRVMYCLQGYRFYLGMSMEKLLKSFDDYFKTPPTGLPQLAAWLRRQSVENIIADGFTCMLTPGDVMIVPHGYLVLEACLGGEQDIDCHIASYTCLVPNGHAWLEYLKACRELGIVPSHQETQQEGQDRMQALFTGMNVLERMLLLSQVKQEQSAEAEGDDAVAAAQTQTPSAKLVTCMFLFVNHIYVLILCRIF